MEEPVPLSLQGIKWHYKGEGNSNLVLSLSDLKMIVRLYKTEEGCSKKKKDFGKAKREVIFWKRILIPHLGKHLKAPILASVNEVDAREIDRILKNHRPKHRLNKSVSSGLVTIYPDYTFLPTSNLFSNINCDNDESVLENRMGSIFCVEIKPKQGWTHPADRQTKCTFCLNQYLKLDSGRASNLSGYCPLDLFSGNRVRMKQALRNLLKNPQNNLKMFQDGHIIFSDNSNCDYEEVIRRWFGADKLENTEKLIDKWTELVYSALTCDIETDCQGELLNFLEQSEQVNYETPPSIFSILTPCDWSSEQLPSKCILNKILQLQKLQDTDFKSVYSCYKQLEPNTDDFQYVSKLFDQIHLDGLGRYLLAATAKDCSISIAFNRSNINDLSQSEFNIICDLDGVHYETSIGVLDLDPKPLSCIDKHYNRDLNIHSAYLKYTSKNEPLKNIINKINF